MVEILEIPAQKTGKFLTVTEPRRRKTRLGALADHDS
jgi:hypothetical protein